MAEQRRLHNDDTSLGGSREEKRKPAEPRQSARISEKIHTVHINTPPAAAATDMLGLLLLMPFLRRGRMSSVGRNMLLQETDIGLHQPAGARLGSGVEWMDGDVPIRREEKCFVTGIGSDPRGRKELGHSNRTFKA